MRAGKTLNTQTQKSEKLSAQAAQTHQHTTPRTLAHVNIHFAVAGLVSGFLAAYTAAHGG